MPNRWKPRVYCPERCQSGRMGLTRKHVTFPVFSITYRFRYWETVLRRAAFLCGTILGLGTILAGTMAAHGQLLAPAYAEVNCRTEWYSGVSYRFPVDPVYREQRLWPQRLSQKSDRITSIRIGDRSRREVGACLFS